MFPPDVSGLYERIIMFTVVGFVEYLFVRSCPAHVCEPVWPSGKAFRLVNRGTSVRIHFGSPFSSKVVVCGHCLVPLSLTINETLKWLSSLPILI